jgi:polyphosphate kinase
MYMASADLMNRNLNRRIEVGFPVKEESLKQDVMKILQLQLEDNTKARVLDSEHNNLVKQPGEGDRRVRAQIETYRLLGKQVSEPPL